MIEHAALDLLKRTLYSWSGPIKKTQSLGPKTSRSSLDHGSQSNSREARRPNKKKIITRIPSTNPPLNLITRHHQHHSAWIISPKSPETISTKTNTPPRSPIQPATVTVGKGKPKSPNRYGEEVGGDWRIGLQADAELQMRRR